MGYMARINRVHYSGAFYHAILKGNNGSDIFTDDFDRLLMEDLLSKAINKFGSKIHAFCFMTNHIHLLIEVGEISLGVVMHDVARKYARDFNRRFDRKGHLFQERYKSILVSKEDYFIEVCRYIHLNPVRANMVTSASEYKWSSHNNYLRQNNFSWVTTSRILSHFGEQEDLALKGYEAFMGNHRSVLSPKLAL